MEAIMQVVILICLIVIIVLLCLDKVRIVSSEKAVQTQNNPQPQPEVMGKVLDNTQYKHKNAANKKFVAKVFPVRDKSALIENRSEEDILREDTKRNAVEEVQDDDIPADDDRFSQAFSLDELMKVGSLLQQETLNPSDENETIAIIEKIQGTEFFSTMQASIEDNAVKIAKLLDKSLAESNIIKSGSANDDLGDFDINNFI